jgi:hypothetical protein
MLTRRVLLILGALGTLAACGSAASVSPTTQTRALPLSGLPALVPTTPPVIETAPVSTAPPPATGQIGTRVQGNSVILIGDSVLAGTALRYGGAMCEALVPLGWNVELDAETGQFVPWGNEVLDARLGAGWDTAVILLGNNFLGDKSAYKFELERMVTRLSPAPVVLVKVTMYRPNRALVNEAIDELAAAYPNVVVIDWGALTTADRQLTGDDHLHLTGKGRRQLSAEVANVLGQAPTPPGSCLPSDYTDDSRISVTGEKGGAASTTAPGGVATTAAGGVATSPPNDPPVTKPPATTPGP